MSKSQNWSLFILIVSAQNTVIFTEIEDRKFLKEKRIHMFINRLLKIKTVRGRESRYINIKGVGHLYKQGPTRTQRHEELGPVCRQRFAPTTASQPRTRISKRQSQNARQIQLLSLFYSDCC